MIYRTRVRSCDRSFSLICVITFKLLFIFFLTGCLSNESQTKCKTEKNGNLCKEPKYSERFNDNHPYLAYFDYEEGRLCAEELNKPILLIFDGWGVKNARKIQKGLFSKKDILDYMTSNFVIICLYINDDTELPENEKYCLPNGKEVVTLGHKNIKLQTKLFRTGSQPSIGILNHENKLLSPVLGYTLDQLYFMDWLKRGKNEFDKHNI